MNNKQKLTPKYWVGHDPESDDVFLDTATKSYIDTQTKMCEKFGDNNIFDNSKYEIVLIEICLVNR